MKTKEQILFEDAPVGRAVISLVIPTVISQMITVIYNMADTFFVSLTGQPAMIAAVTLCAPILLIIMSIACIFGMGGSSVIARGSWARGAGIMPARP